MIAFVDLSTDKWVVSIYLLLSFCYLRTEWTTNVTVHTLLIISYIIYGNDYQNINITLPQEYFYRLHNIITIYKKEFKIFLKCDQQHNTPKLINIHYHTIISLPFPALKGSSADCNRMKLTAIHLKEYKVNSIKVCTQTFSFGFFLNSRGKCGKRQ